MLEYWSGWDFEQQGTLKCYQQTEIENSSKTRIIKARGVEKQQTFLWKDRWIG